MCNKVMVVVQVVGYKFNLMVVKFCLGKMYNLVVLVFMVVNVFFVCVISGMQEVVVELGYFILFVNMFGNSEIESYYVKMVSIFQVDGFIQLCVYNLFDVMMINDNGLFFMVNVCEVIDDG